MASVAMLWNLSLNKSLEITAGEWSKKQASRAACALMIDVGEFPYLLWRRDHCGAELFMERRALSIFIVHRAAHPAVCVCAIKKLNRNRRHYFFPHPTKSIVTVVGHAMSKKKKWKSVKTEARYQRGCHEKIIYYARERVRPTRRIIEIWGK